MPSVRGLLLVLSLSLAFLRASAQGMPRKPPAVRVLMMADIHFDPFREPAKVAALRGRPLGEWPALLAAPAAQTQEADLAAMQKACGARALDTAWPLLQQALKAAQDEEAHPAFVLVPGDLLTHDFDCRFRQADPQGKDAERSAFAAKTLRFVLERIEAAFPQAPVYAALGNNDSGCGDYRFSPGDAFAREAAAAVLAAARLPARAGEGAASDLDGDFSFRLPAPLGRIRLVVLNDTVRSRLFRNCAGQAEMAPAKAQIAWLDAQLAAARAQGEGVWLMGHIPPGIDLYTSYRQYVLRPGALCGAAPQRFLADTSLERTLVAYADVVRLAVFGHTHMDELRVLEKPPASDALPAAEAAIPVKIVPSVSPYLGNHPAFLVAEVEARTGVLQDWTTFVSPGPEGATPPWTAGYRYSEAYRLPDFGADAAARLAAGLSSDRAGTSEQAAVFRHHLYPGDLGFFALGVAQIWPAYGCALRERGPEAFLQCMCPAPSPHGMP